MQAKRGRGRPRKPILAKAAAAANAEKHSQAGQGNTLLDAAFLSESACCLIEIADEVIARTLAAKVAKAMPDKLAEFVRLQASVGFGEKDKEMVGLSVNAMAQKYEWMTKFGPEIFFLAWATQYTVRQARLVKFVNDLAADREKLGPTKPAPAPFTPPPAPKPGDPIPFPGPAPSSPAAARN